MSRHGRATIPIGQYKGSKVAALPDQYLLWLLESVYASSPKWHWLIESVKAELRHRGFHPDNVVPEPPPTFRIRCTNCAQLFESTYQRPVCDSCKAIIRSGLTTIGATQKCVHCGHYLHPDVDCRALDAAGDVCNCSNSEPIGLPKVADFVKPRRVILL